MFFKIEDSAIVAIARDDEPSLSVPAVFSSLFGFDFSIYVPLNNTPPSADDVGRMLGAPSLSFVPPPLSAVLSDAVVNIPLSSIGIL